MVSTGNHYGDPSSLSRRAQSGRRGEALRTVKRRPLNFAGYSEIGAWRERKDYQQVFLFSRYTGTPSRRWKDCSLKRIPLERRGIIYSISRCGFC